jgi:hypothetical protein
VKSVDPLPTDEAYKSIGADMPDHDRQPPPVHLVCCTLMSTRKHARGVRHQAKSSTTLDVELQNVLKTWLIKY